jgi:hypothetical protein
MAQGVRQVLGDARDLPFPDRTFDAVVAVDLLEHIDRLDRPKVLTELCRVSGRLVVVACPMGTPALKADYDLAKSYAGASRIPPGWLPEHLANGLPEREDVTGVLGTFGAVRIIGNENARWHSWMMRATSRSAGFHAERLAARILAPTLLPGHGGAWSTSLLTLLRGLDRGPTYRTVVVAERTA